jgi:hypothetical protein
LVPRTLLVVAHHAGLGEPLPYVGRHGIGSALDHATITPRIEWPSKGCRSTPAPDAPAAAGVEGLRHEPRLRRRRAPCGR